MIGWIVAGVVCGFILLTGWACCRVSGICSQQERDQEMERRLLAYRNVEFPARSKREDAA